MSNNPSLFNPVQMGAISLSNRVLMAPLTRNRAHSDGTPKEMAQTYYSQRASAGLIITEATQISDMGKGYLDTPGIYRPNHIVSWKKITDAVHATGGKITVQLWHVGRISHKSLLPVGQSPVAPSAIKANAQVFNAQGFVDCSTPIALDEAGIANLHNEYRIAAQGAKEAGFDGIEVHAANGYLIDQFLQDGTNKRRDKYGGSVENRTRLLTEVLDVVGEIWPSDRIGVRLSPLGQANDISDSDPESLFSHVYKELSARNLAYMHVVESFPGATTSNKDTAILARLRKLYNGFFVANGGYNAKSASRAIDRGEADAIAFGRPFLANPDLPERYRTSAPLNEPDGSTFYGGGEKGYTDYPFLDDNASATRSPLAAATPTSLLSD